MKKLVLVTILVVILLNSCSKQQLSPEDTMKVVLDNVVKGDVDESLSYFIDEQGNPLSQEFKQNMKDSLQRNPISSYKIVGIRDFDSSLPQFSNLNIPLLKNAKIVSFSITEKTTQRTQENQLVMVQHEGTWKILMAVQPYAAPAKPSPSQTRQETVTAPITQQETVTPELNLNKCGNSICEEPENYESCPSDCTPNSMLEKIKIAENDLPLIPGNSGWSKNRDDTLSESHLDNSIRNLGLVAGHMMGFESDKAEVNQQILIYPANNINRVLDATNPNEVLRWAGPPENIKELPSPNIGDRSRAFTTFLNNEPYSHYIAFTKNQYYELIMTKGSGGNLADYKLLEDIARKAADKIS